MRYDVLISPFPDRKYQSSRPSTCQALLLLAIREFGMGKPFFHIILDCSTWFMLGAMDKGWLYSGKPTNTAHLTLDVQSIFTGMAMRMVRLSSLASS